MKYQVLVIDDDSSIRNFLYLSLENSDYSTAVAENGKKALFSIAAKKPDLIILDRDLPDMNGFEILQIIKRDFNIPTLMLTVEDSYEEKVKFLDAGADDYLTKPFSIQELLARIRVIIRHAYHSLEPIFKIANLEIDFNLRKVRKNGMEIKLTVTEYSILALLAKNFGKVITQEHLLKDIWGPSLMGQSHYLRIYIAQLRKKLENNPSQPKIILTETGIGYRLANF